MGAIFEAIGIKGIVIIALAVFIGFQQLKVKSLESDITDLQETIGKKNVEIGTLKGSIDTQNKAVEAANKKRDEIQKELDKANQERIKVSIEYERIKGEIINRPLPTSCIEAITDLKSENIKAAKKWNK